MINKNDKVIIVPAPYDGGKCNHSKKTNEDNVKVIVFFKI